MDREGFISHLTKNGAFSKEEAEQLADEEFGGKTPVPTPLSPYDEGNAATDLSRVQSDLTGQRSPAHKGLGDLWEGLSAGEKAAVVGGLGLVGISSAIGLGTVGKKIKDRLISKPQEIDRTIDIPMDRTVAPAPTTEAPLKSLLSQQDMTNKAAKELEDATKAATQNKPLPSQSGFVGPESPFQGPKLPEFIGPPESPFVGPKLPPFVGPPESDIFGPPKPIAPPEIPQAEAPAAISAETEKPAGKKRGPKTADQKAAEATQLQQTIANTPEDRLPSAPNPKKSNKLLPTDVIGQGGWHWYQGQMGPQTEENWLRAFGRTNQSYADVKQAMKEGRLPGPVVPEGKKGGAFPREATVPGYIKGAIAPGALGLTAAMAAAAGLLTPGKADAKSIARSVGESLLPIGLTPSELASGTLPPEKVAALQAFMKERQKLGSPYRSVPPPGP